MKETGLMPLRFSSRRTLHPPIAFCHHRRRPSPSTISTDVGPAIFFRLCAFPTCRFFSFLCLSLENDGNGNGQAQQNSRVPIHARDGPHDGRRVLPCDGDALSPQHTLAPWVLTSPFIFGDTLAIHGSPLYAQLQPALHAHDAAAGRDGEPHRLSYSHWLCGLWAVHCQCPFLGAQLAVSRPDAYGARSVDEHKSWARDPCSGDARLLCPGLQPHGRLPRHGGILLRKAV